MQVNSNLDTSAAPSPQLADKTLMLLTVVVRRRKNIPTSPPRFDYLTRERVLALYGAADEEIDAVEAYFTQHGLTIVDKNQTDPNQEKLYKCLRMVAVRGTQGDVEKAFGTTVFAYRNRAGGAAGDPENYFGSERLRAELGPCVETVLGLDDFTHNKRPNTTSGLKNNYGVKLTDERLKLDTPLAVETYYAFPPGNGDGQCVGIIEMGGGYNPIDVFDFFQRIGVNPRPDIADVPVHSPSGVGQNRSYVLGSPSDQRMAANFARWMNGDSAAIFQENAKDYSEVTMDVSIIGALLPRATIKVFFSLGSMRALLFSIGHALFCTEPQPSVLSISWGVRESGLLDNNSDKFAALQINDLFLVAAHMGVTICCASGDWGASNENVNDPHVGEVGYPDVTFPASSPYALACGGTTICADTRGEVVWNADFPPNPDQDWQILNCVHGATGGGFSHIFLRPLWQAIPEPMPTLITRDAGLMTINRWLPDVAAVADPQCGMRFRLAGEWALCGGTSAAAPIWAALVARLNQNLGRRVGCLTPLLYAQTSSASGALKDITEGDNRFFGGDVGFEAGPGFDPCTGLGTPNGVALLALLKSLAGPPPAAGQD